MRAVQFDRLGGPEAVASRSADARATPGTVLVRNRVIAVNFGDLWFIRGQYLVKPRFPDTPGMEAAGIVEAVAPTSRIFARGWRSPTSAWARSPTSPASEARA